MPDPKFTNVFNQIWGFNSPDLFDIPDEPEVIDDHYEIPEKIQTDIKPGDRK